MMTTMRFNVTQHYPTSRDEVMSLYTGTELWSQLSGFTKVSILEVLDRSQSGSKVTLRLRYKFIAPLPAVATAVVDPKRLIWVEETVTDLDTGLATVAFQPEHYASKMEASAKVRFEEDGDACIRQVDGDMKIHMFLVGGQVEKVICSGLSEHLGQEEKSVLKVLAG